MKRLWLCFLAIAVATLAHSQSTSVSAGTLAAQSVAALTDGASISDVTLTGNATWSFGSDRQSGSVTLLAKGFGESRMDLSLSGGSRSEVRNVSGYPNQGNWIGADGVVHAIALHNCFTDSSWFFPALSALAAASTSNISLNYVGLESLGQTAVQHLHLSRVDASVAYLQQLSGMDVYLDSQSLLPSVIAFNEHPDNDQTINILVEIMFSDYRKVNGAAIPFHIEKFLNNSLVLDIQLSAAALNSGIPDSNFNVQ